MSRYRLPLMISAFALACSGASAAPVAKASAVLKNAEGKENGSVTFEHGDEGLLVTVEATGLSEGWHAIHVHEKGECVGDFTGAGSHANPEKHDHGILTAKGMHVGDMPNIYAHADGAAKAQFFLDEAKLSGKEGLLDKDGAAVIVHEKADDYKTQPTGDAGPRVLCGVLGAQ